MAKIKVKINNPTPPPEIIRQYRDFNGFMNRYKSYYSTQGIRDMLYNDRKKLVYIIIIILLLLILLFADDINGEDLKPSSPDNTELKQETAYCNFKE